MTGLLRRRLPHVHHRLADVLREVELGHRERLGRVLVAPVGGRLRGRAFARTSARPARRCRRCRPCPCRTPRGGTAAPSGCRGARSRAARRAATRTCARSAPRATASAPAMVTSSGMRPSSISLRTKSKSVCDADGKPDLDLLEADRAPARGTCAACGPRPSARSAPGCRRAGRSTARSAAASACGSATGGSARSIVGNGRYFCAGSVFMRSSGLRGREWWNHRPLLRTARALLELGGGVLCAREAQQKQQAQDERECGRGTGPGALGEERNAAHRATIPHRRRAMQAGRSAARAAGAVCDTRGRPRKRR